MRRSFSSLPAADQEALGQLGRAMMALLVISTGLTAVAGIVGAENTILFPAGVIALLGLIFAGWMYVLHMPWLWPVSTVLLVIAVLTGAEIGVLIAGLY